MRAPYKGKFRISQTYKEKTHDGLDLVGIDSKRVYSTVAGRVVHAGWENSDNHRQGFGLYVKIEFDISGVMHCAYFGHLARLAVQVGDVVQIGDAIGTEGSTGRSTGSHVHYCVRKGGVKGKHININTFSDIPNALGTYTSTLGSTGAAAATPAGSIKSGSKGAEVKALQEKLIAAGYDCGTAGADGICGAGTVKAIKAYQKDAGLKVDGIAGPKTLASLEAKPAEVVKSGSEGPEVKALQEKLIAAGYDCGKAGADGIAGPATVKAIKAYQKDKGLKVDGIAGPKTLASLK